MPGTRLLFLIVLIVAGLIIVILPDNNQRLFSLSKDHGPSLQDAIGILMILIPYVYFLFKVWRVREKIVALRNTPFFIPALILFLLSMVVLVVSILNDLGWWWLPAASIMALLQVYVFYVALRQPGRQ